MKDQISALADGELDEAEAGRLIARLKSDPDLRRAWDDYHRVGDALRGHLGADLSARVASRLAAEPTVLVRGAAPTPAQHAGRWLLSAAASLAAIAFVAWMALPWRTPAPELAQAQPSAPLVIVPATPLASGPQVASVPQASPNPRARAEADARAQAEALAALGMRNYLLAHQRYSASTALQGMAPYARTVASDGDDR